MRVIASGWFALAFGLWCSCAQAQHESNTFSLDYLAPAGCPERAAFVTSLLTRSRGAHVQLEAPRVALAVLLAGNRELASGTLVIKLADGQESRREIPAASCTQVLASMALIAAMILDGGGLDDAPPRTSAGQSDALATPAPLTRGTQPGAPQRVPVDEITKARSERNGIRRARLAAIAGLGPQSGVAPDLVPRFFAGLGLVFEHTGELSPSLDLVASVALSAREVNPYGDARFRLLALTLTGCPLRFPLAARFALRPCLPLELGVLRGSGDNTVLGRKQDTPWLGLGAALRTEASLSPAWLLELEGRATLLARADRFVFEPDSVVHQVPRVVFGLRLAAVLRVP